LNIIGLDLSLTSTGLAEVHDWSLANVHRLKTKGHRGMTVAETSARIAWLVDEIDAWVDGDDVDLAVIEAPSFGSKFGNPHERGGLWWSVAQRLVGREIPVATVSPQGRAKYATGKGNSKKDVVEAAVRSAYTDVAWPTGKCDDIADAVILAAMGARHLGEPIDPWVDSLPAQLAAMDGASWPS